MIRVQSEDFDVGQEFASFTQNKPQIGGVGMFVGLVRDHLSSGEKVLAMTLEHYPGMTERQLEKIVTQAYARWPLDDCRIIHRYGKLLPGDKIVLVLTASAHRKAALEACEFLIDWLKTKATFWKLEETEKGAHWVEAKDSDDKALEKWL